MGVDIRYYSVIYPGDRGDRGALKGMLKPEFEEASSAPPRSGRSSGGPGSATWRLAGSAPAPSTGQQGPADPRRRRDLRQPDRGFAARFKEDATEVREGYECGIGIGYRDIRVGDTIETFEMREKPRA